MFNLLPAQAKSVKCSKKRISNKSLAILVTSLLLYGGTMPWKFPVWANTPAGTEIRNQGLGVFEDVDNLGNVIEVTSNEVVLIVAEVAGITVVGTSIDEAPETVAGAGSSQNDGTINPGDVVYFTFTITNVGNDSTQFFIPDAPSAITGGTLAGDIQLMSYDPDGTDSSTEDLSANNITVPSGGATTGTLLDGIAAAYDGAVLRNGAIAIRVPIKIDANLNDQDTVTVVMGDTPVPPNASEQNESFSAGNQDIYTQDNADGVVDEAEGIPINGEREASTSQDVTVATTSASLDYGDAPDIYGTDDTAGNSNSTTDPIGANHNITAGLFLGATAPDADPNGFVDGIDDNENATDDDEVGGTGNGDDEDNFILPELNTTATSYTIPAANITATNTTATDATLHAWIDFDRNGEFEPAEYASVPVNQGTNDGNPTADLIWNGITVGAAGDTYARFRLTTDSSIDSTTPGGNASDGEVEDYQIAIAASSVSSFAGQLVINEVLYAQTGTNSAAGNDEFIELFNASNTSIDLSGFQLIDGNLLVSVTDDPAAFDGTSGSITNSQSPYVFPGGTILQAGEYAVIWIGNQNDAAGNQISERFADEAVFQDWLGNAPKLNNAGDDVWLYDADTKIIDYMVYGTGAGINTRPDPTFNLWDGTDENKLDDAARGQSISLTPNGQDGNTSACWSKTALATTDADSASGRCPDFLETRDTDTAVVNSNQRITSVGASNNGTNTTSPDLLLVKRITVINPGKPNERLFIDFVDDATDDDNNPLWLGSNGNANTYTLGEIDGGQVSPNDVIEYTIYYLSNGSDTAQNVLICDLIPEHTEFINNNFDTLPGATGGISGTDRGLAWEYNGNIESLTNGSDGDGGYYFAPGVNPASTDALDTVQCDALNSPNTNGAVVVDLDSLSPAITPGSPANSYGLIRFRVRVK